MNNKGVAWFLDHDANVWEQREDGTLSALRAASGVYESVAELESDVGRLTQVDAETARSVLDRRNSW